MPGSPMWRSGAVAASRQLELYLSTDSQLAGGYVSVKVASDVSSRIDAEIYRLGHYGGDGARLVWSGGPYDISTQPACPRQPDTNRVECNWGETFYFQIPSDWLSGVYLVKVIRSDGERFKRFAPFVVLDRRPAEILYQPTFNTYQAYNQWGGASLYWGVAGRAVEVSYDRPYDQGEGAGLLFWFDYHFLKFLEKSGYDVTYASNIDFNRFGNLLSGIGAFVTAGHDEYWHPTERAQVDTAVDSGQTSHTYFGANGAFWRIRYRENSTTGRPLRTLVCYKSYDDPVSDPPTVHFSDPPDPHPENLLYGIAYDSVQAISFPLVVGDPNHWLYQGTDVVAGEALPGLQGVEWDRIWPDRETPADVRVIQESPVLRDFGTAGAAHTVERNLPAGNTVFAAGTFFWSSALALNQPEFVDDRVARMTQNVLERALAHRRPPVEPPPTGPLRPTPPQIAPEWAASVSALAGSARIAGWADGPGYSARFSGPLGLAAGASGQIIVADGNNHLIRRIDADGTTATIAGTGFPGSADDRPGNQASFSAPTGVAVAADGTIYVADSDNHVIRRIQNDAPTFSVSTYAGRMRDPGWVDSADPLSARFDRPMALALDGSGNLYVAEMFGNRIRQIAQGSRSVSTYAGNGESGALDAPVATDARFAYPSALAVGPAGEVYVLDASTQFLRRISPSGSHPVDTIAGSSYAIGYGDGAGSDARFRAQMGMAVGLGGEIYLADSGNFRMRKVIPGSSIDTARVTTIAGTGRVGMNLGSGDTADIVLPAGVAVLPDGRIAVSDAYNQVIRLITPRGTSGMAR
ncbi:MAG TPA: N,N-dimethylformamidase beta subunit family domain-containing protein [Myxococcaceae bacterium]|nr:N,N-dimethylformamidase beta subunit family domain-containing protein [Myxococcaceae bacterium]